MTVRLAFVHGIGGPRCADEELAIWRAALARGAVAAGHTAAAEALRAGTGVELVFAYYGDLFGKAGAQGTGSGLSEQDAEVVRGLLLDLTEQQLDLGTDEDSRILLVDVHEQLSRARTAQGPGNVARLAIGAVTTLMEWRPLRQAGQWASSKMLVQQLGQVARYLNRDESDGRSTLDQRIRARVRASLGDGPVVVAAHSLGSVVALEVLHEFTGQVPLFVTLGSPIGMRTTVWPRLRPQPPATPEPVGNWLNFWDRDDIIACRPRMEKAMAPNRAAVLPRSSRIDSDGIWVHSAVKYLAQPAIAGPLVEAVFMPGGGI